MEKTFKICVLRSRTDPTGPVWYCHTVQDLKNYRFDLKKNYISFKAGNPKNKSNAFYIFERYGTDPKSVELVELETFTGTKTGADGRVSHYIMQNPDNVNILSTNLEAIIPERPASVRRPRTPSPRPSSSRVQQDEIAQVAIPATPVCERLKRLSIVNNCNIVDIPPEDRMGKLTMVMNTISDIPPIETEERAVSPIRSIFNDMAVSPRSSPVRQVEEPPSRPASNRSTPVLVTKKDFQQYLTKRLIYYRARDDLATLKQLYEDDQKRIKEEMEEMNELLDE